VCAPDAGGARPQVYSPAVVPNLTDWFYHHAVGTKGHPGAPLHRAAHLPPATHLPLRRNRPQPRLGEGRTWRRRPVSKGHVTPVRLHHKRGPSSRLAMQTSMRVL